MVVSVDEISLEKLGKINNSTVIRFLKMLKGEFPKVDTNYYANTIFGSVGNYEKEMSFFSGQIRSALCDNIAKTPMVFMRQGTDVIFPSSYYQGVAFGVQLFEYENKVPFITVVVDCVDKTNYKYESAIYVSGNYYKTRTKLKSVLNTKELFFFTLEELKNDVGIFGEKK